MDDVGFVFLAIEQRDADVVTFPDGRREIVAPGQGRRIADDWNAAQLAATEEEAQRLRAEYEQQRAETGTPSADEVERIYEERHARWEQEMADELRRLETSSSAGFGTAEGRRRAYLLRHPEPTLATVRDELLKPPEAASDAASDGDEPQSLATVTQQEGHWWSRLFGSAREDDRFLSPPGPLPRAEIASMLSELKRDGWEVVHVSEERAAIHDGERSVTTCLGLNVLLRR